MTIEQQLEEIRRTLQQVNQNTRNSDTENSSNNDFDDEITISQVDRASNEAKNSSGK